MPTQHRIRPTVRRFASRASSVVVRTLILRLTMAVVVAPTGVATLVGPSPLGRGMAFDSAGNLYAALNGTFDVHSIDTARGASSRVATLPFFMAGMAFDPTSGLLYGDVSGGSDGSLYRIDPSTWQTELVGSSGPYSLSGIGAFACWDGKE